MLAWQPSGGLGEALFGPQAPAVTPGPTGLALIGGPSSPRPLAPTLAARFSTSVATAVIREADQSYSWSVDGQVDTAALAEML